MVPILSHFIAALLSDTMVPGTQNEQNPAVVLVRMEEADADVLFGGLESEAPLLPSVVELRSELKAATAERSDLETALAALQADELATREAIKDLTQRACVLLATARREIQRKDEQLSKLGAVPSESSASACQK